MEIPQKIKVKLPYDLAIPLLHIYLKNTKPLIWKDVCTSTFIAALFTIANIWKQPKCPSIDEWIKMLWYIYIIYIHIHIYNGILHSCIKERNLTICNNMDGPWGYYAKWNKSDRERQIPYDFTYMWNLKNKTN